MDGLTFAVVMLSLGLAGAVYHLFAAPLLAVPALGYRGLERQLARRQGSFQVLEPLVRLLAAHVERTCWLGPRLGAADERLVRGGDFLGLLPQELFALSAVGTLGGVAAAVLMANVAGLGPVGCAAVVLSGAALPELQLRSTTRAREKAIGRALPAAIELAAMCMGAGLDFPGSLAQVVANTPPRAPIRRELERILQELGLGHTRKQALEGLAQRVRSDAVREFVSATVQAEEKGTPLAEVLRTQAGSLRMRRSVFAEEAAARAGALMILPMMMLFGCILLLVLGPMMAEISMGGL